MAKRLKVSLLGILMALMCFALAFGFTAWNGGITANAETVSEDGTTVTFNTLDDFVTNSAKTRIDGLSADAWTTINNKLDTLNEIIIEAPDTITIGFGAPFFTSYAQKSKKLVPITLKIPTSVTRITGMYLPQINVTKVIIAEGNTGLSGNANGDYVVQNRDNTVVWSNGVLPENAEITKINPNGALCGTNVHIPANITSIPSRSLYFDNLENISVAAENTAYGDGGGNNCLVDIANKTLMVSPDGYIPADGSVTSIADGALRNASEVTIPAAIETFTNQAFGEALTQLTIASDHPTYTDGGNNCLISRADKKLVFATKATDMTTVFNGVEIIGSNAFNGLDITELVVPETVNKMEGSALGGLAKLETLSLPFVGKEKTVEGGTAGLETRFGYIFPSGSGNSDYFSISQTYNSGAGAGTTISALIPKTLKTVSITGSGITLLDWSLMGLEVTNLENLYLPDDISFASVRVLQGYLPNYAVDVPLGKYVTENEADGNYYLYSVTDHTKPVVLVSGNKTAALVEIPEGITTVCESAFRSAKTVEVVLPSTLKSIQEEAFYRCKDLALVYNLSNLDIKKGSEEHGGVALYAATVSKQFNGSAMVTEGDYTFMATEEPALYRYNGTAKSLTLPNDYKGKRYVIADSAFAGNTAITEIVIPAMSALGIGNNAFEGCTSLKSIVINDLENSIGKAAFKGCTSLTSITFNNCHITEIADEAFMNCSSLLEIAVPDTVLTIGTSAFEECTSAVAITLGNKVKYIGGKAFANTSSLKTATIPDSVTELGYGGGEILVGNPWKRDYVFAGSGIESVYIGSGLQYMGNTFADCVNLKEITFSQNSSLKNISYAFVNCTALTTLTIPEGVIKAQYALNGVTNLTSLYIPYSLVNVTSTASADLTTRYSDMSLRSTESPYPEYAHLTMYLPDLPKDATAEEIDAFARKLAVFAVYSDYSSIDTYVMGNSQFNVNTVFANQVTVLSKEAYDAVHKVLSDTTDGNLYSTFTTFGRYFSNYEGLHREDVLSHFYYLTDVKYELYKLTVQEKPLATETVQKLAQNEGADIRYVLKTDKYGSKYYAIDSNYAMPSMINGMNTGATWKVGTTDGEALDLATAKISGKTTFVNLLGADDKLTVNYEDEYTKDYNGKAWTLAGTSLEGKADITSATLNGNSVDVKNITDAGTYTVTVTANSNYEFASGESTATFTVVINKVQATVTWKWNEKTLTEGNTESKDFDGKTIASQLTLSYVDVNGDTQAISNGLLRRLLNGTGSTANAMNEGLWTLYLDELVYAKDHPNYTFAHASHEFRIYNKKLSADEAYKGLAIDLDGEASLSRATLYIYQKGSDIVPSYTQLGTGYTLIEVINVQAAIARYTNTAHTIAATVNPDSADKLTVTKTENAMFTDIGRYTTTFTVTAKDNYEFALTGSVTNASALGLDISVSNDGKTMTIHKTWYIVQLSNELVKASFTGDSEPTADDLYTVIRQWTYGDNVTFELPKLWRGSAADNDAHVTFTLEKSGVQNDIVTNAARADLFNYLNQYMPAGDYTLIVNVSKFDTADASYPAFSRRYEFTVAKATIGIDASKLPKDNTTGYANYTWELTANANKELFFKAFADMVKPENGAFITTVMKDTENANNHWMKPAVYNEYFGGYTVKYNFARMNNEVYVAANNNDMLTLINGGAKGTYTVYFQVEMKNHEHLTNVGDDGRYAYFFTVTVYETLPLPTVNDDGLVYTGNKVLPEIVEDGKYNIVWSDTDTYIAGGEHSVSFVLTDSVHYRWNGVDGNTASVTFTVEKADNAFTVALNMLGWNFETFDAAVNNIRAAVKFLDDGKNITFRVTKKGEATAVTGLDGFTIDENGKVSDTVAGLLNGLKTGDYTLYAKADGTNNYNVLERNIDFKVSKAMNAWADGDEDLVLPSWIVGKYNADENPIVVNAAHGSVNIVITDIDGKEYYNSVTGVNKLNDCEVGKYLLKAWVDETEDFAALAERTFTIEVLEKIGLPWWGTLLITLGALLVAAAIILILWKKGVFQILTQKIVVAIRTRASVEATIASVRTAKKMEEGKQSVAEAKRRERIEEMRRKAAEARALPPEERAAQLEERAKAEAEKAEKSRKRSEQMQARAARLRGRPTEQSAEQPTEQPTEAAQEAAATDDTETPTEE